MKKLKKIDYLYILLIISTIIVYLLLFTNLFKYTYGSRVDWDVQHWIIPDYLRKLFYNNKSIITNLAINLGSGQNIFYSAYYGFLSPFILFSYLLPFIPMHIYIQIISVSSLVISSILFYRFILNKSNSKIAFISTLLLFSMTPILYHSHRHIMFVLYYPFLIIGLYGVDKFVNNKKYFTLIISLFLLIMTNYFFSVSSLICLYLYGISQIIAKKLKTRKEMIRELFHLAFPFIIAILLGAIIILPTFYTIIFGRSPSNSGVELYSLLLPDFSFSRSLYSTYSIGLNYILLMPMLYFIIQKEKNSELFSLSLMILILLMFPLFSYIMNATMYVDYKVFIPFCPLVVYIFSNYYGLILEKRINKKSIIKSFLIIFFIALFNLLNSNNALIIVEILFIIIQTILLKKDMKKLSFLMITIGIVTIICISSMYKEKRYNIYSFKNVVQENAYLYDKYISKDDNWIYRIAFLDSKLQNSNYIYNPKILKISNYSSVSNNYYKHFYSDYSGNEISQRSFGKIVDSSNPFFNIFMGVKYIYNDKELVPGYDKLEDNIYINSNAFPIVYASNKIMSYREFKSLDYPYNMEAYLKYIIVDKEIDNVFASEIDELKPIISKKGLKIETNEKYNIEIEKTEKYEYTIENWDNENDLLIISFDIEPNKCPRDLKIEINDVTNVLSCEQWKYFNKNTKFKYIVTSNDNKIKVNIEKGNYVIDNIKYYTINKKTLNKYDIEKPSKLELYEDRIEAELNIEKDDSYFILTVPFDKGFTFYVDGEKVEYEMVNTAFLGFKIDRGKHKIIIKYQSPLFKEGLIITSSTTLIILLYILNKKSKKNKQ